jgi:hypothetical protein
VEEAKKFAKNLKNIPELAVLVERAERWRFAVQHRNATKP